jgi:uncharacterized protein (AIM24 family)
MKAQILGTTLPVLEIELDPGEKVISEPGQFSWMASNIQLQTSAMTAGTKSIWGVIGRAIAGGGIFMNEYQALGSPGIVAFAAKVPGTIMEVPISGGQNYMIHRHGFLAGTEGVQLSIGFQKSLGAGIFGGDGFILERLSGDATAWVELGGEVFTYDLAPGQQLMVHPGHIGMFDATVNFDVTLIPGIKNIIFGGDGIFVGRLTGPGKVWLQTLTMPNLAHALSPYLGRESGSPTAVGAGVGGAAGGLGGAAVGGIAGSILGGLFSDN